MSLASKLPWTHRFAGGYPGIGSQPLPTDSDCLTYLAAVKAADGAGVEVGVATAVDAFFRDTKASGVFDALKACCILAGARTLAGALVPVVGDAPTNVANGFVSGDYSRTDGITGDGTSYLDSGLDQDDLGQNNNHACVYKTVNADPADTNFFLLKGNAANFVIGNDNRPGFEYNYFRNMNGTADTASAIALGFVAMSRSSATSYNKRNGGTTNSVNATSAAPSGDDITILNPGDATVAFYSVGESLSLADLETAVTSLMTAIGNAVNVPLDGGGSSVNVAPTVTLQPTNATASEGSTATFTSAASGSPTPTVQWQLSTDGGSSWADIGGATSGSYTTPTLTAGDDGNQYRAVWSNSEGTATSNAATLSVTVAVVGSSLWILDAYPPVFHWST